MAPLSTLGIAVNDAFHNPVSVHALQRRGKRFRKCRASENFIWKRTALINLCFLMCGCRLWQAKPEPSIEFSRVPPSEAGGADNLDIIQGRVIGGHPGQRIVLYAKSGTWWVQPLVGEPFTRHRSLSQSQRFRFDRPVFHEDSRAQGPGADAIRTAVSWDAGRGHVDFRCPWGCRSQALPRGSHARSLSLFSGLKD